jgi:hypothetical protein
MVKILAVAHGNSLKSAKVSKLSGPVLTTIQFPDVATLCAALSPDSSRYWPSDCYQVGKPLSFDMQFLRDWLTGASFKKGHEKGVDG